MADYIAEPQGVDQQSLLHNDHHGAPPPYAYNPPPPQGYPQAAPAPAPYPQAAPSYQQGPTVVAINKKWTQIPENHVCQWCGVQGVTSTEYVPGLLTYLAAGGICLVGCWAGCCLIPFCVDSCKDVEHYCPSCRQLVGKYAPM